MTVGPDGTEEPARRAAETVASPRPPGTRALVHIGLNKSGSTTIQTWLARNREALRDQGVAYEEFGTAGPHGFDHAQGFPAVVLTRQGVRVPSASVRAAVGIARFEVQAARASAFEARAEQSFAQAEGATYVVSSEFIAAWLETRAKVEALDAWLSARFARVDYVVYLRDQTEWLASAFAQMIRTGGDRTMEDFIARRGCNDYYGLVRMWTAAVGADRLAVRLLDRDFLRGGDLVADFAGLLGVDPRRTSLPPRMNESLSAASLWTLQRRNRLSRRLEGLGLARTGAALRGLGLPFDRGPKLRLTPEQASRVAAMNEGGNEKLRQWLFPDRPRLFPGSPKPPTAMPDAALDPVPSPGEAPARPSPVPQPGPPDPLTP